jgi:hypothetical protein
MAERWEDVMLLVEGHIKKAGSMVAKIRAKLKSLPPAMPGYGQIYYNADHQHIFISLGDGDGKEEWDAWTKAMESIPGIKKVTGESESRPGASDNPGTWIMIKKAYSPLMHTMGQLTNWVPGPTNQWMGGPNPLAATLATGLLGAGVGYGAGWLGEQFLPEEQFQPGRLRRTMALAGAGLGAAPGLWWGSIAQREHPKKLGLRAWLSSWPFRPEDMRDQYSNTPIKEACVAAAEVLGDIDAPGHYKKAIGEDMGLGLMSVDQVPMIQRDQFSQVVWQDPQTPPYIRAATTGLVDSASAFKGGVRLVSPYDVAKIAVGMGSGYASGLLVGKTLGALAGLRPRAQRQLQQMGTWAGILQNVVPMVFNG